MNVFLCGFGVPGNAILKYLANRSDVKKLMAFTHVDKPHAPGLATMANTLGVPATVGSVNDRNLWPWQPDLIASVYYCTIIQQHVIDAVKGQIFNAHASLLPKHRGRSPVAWALIEGDLVTGVTFHYIDAGVDTGRVLFQTPVWINADETQASLFEKLNWALVDRWPEALELVLLGVQGQPQGTEGLSHHPAGVPFGGEIDPSWSPDEVERFIRAMTLPPYPPAQFQGQPVRTIDDYWSIRNGGQRSD